MYPLKKILVFVGVGEMVQWLRAYTAPPEETSSVLDVNVGQLTTITPAPVDSMPSSGLHVHTYVHMLAHTIHAHTHAYAYTQINFFKKFCNLSPDSARNGRWWASSSLFSVWIIST